MHKIAIDYEMLVQATYDACLKDGDIAVDVGAHIGQHCIPMAERVLPSGKVFAFEPLPMCREILAREIAQHPRGLSSVITIYPYALTDFDGEAEFVVAKDALACSGLKERKYDWPTRLERIIVKVRKIDSLLLDLPSLRYIKIDAEGAEYHILRGAIGCLQRFRPLVCFEFGVSGLAEYKITPRDMATFWGEQAYKLYDITGNYLSEVNRFIQSAKIQKVWYYVAIPMEDTALEKTIISRLRATSKTLAGAILSKNAYRSHLSIIDTKQLQVVKHDQTSSVLVRVRNLGQDPWLIASDIDGSRGWTHLGILWFRPDSTYERLAEHRVELPRTMLGGDEAEVDIVLNPIGPNGDRLPPGEYEVWIGLVEEFVTWFYEMGDDFLELHVSIEGS